MLVERPSRMVLPAASVANTLRNKRPPPPPWSAERLRRATEAAGVALWSWVVDTDEITIDEHAFDLWGMAGSDA